VVTTPRRKTTPRGESAPAPPGRQGPAPTLRDVAALAGVNPSVVSRVLNHDPTLKVTDATRQRVLDAVERLDYRPNALARGLRLATTSAIGFVLPEAASPVYGPIIVGAEARAAEAGYVLVIGSGVDAATTEAAFARLLREGRVDGLLFASGTVEDQLIRGLSDGRHPVIAVNRRIIGAVGSVIVDDESGARLATEHLIGLGHRHITHIAGPPLMDTTVRRHNGYERAMRSAGLAGRVVASAGWDAPAGYRAGREALLDTQVTAMFVASVMAAIGVAGAARDAGRDIPGDLSLVCLHDSPVAAYFDPPLTTVSLPLEDLGRAAVDLLFERLAGGPPRDVMLPASPTLIRRRSTAHPRHG
jgi:LacI family transcriptional regulator